MRSLEELLAELRVDSASEVRVWRIRGVVSGSVAFASKHSREQAENPEYAARAPSVSISISRAEYEALVRAGARLSRGEPRTLPRFASSSVPPFLRDAVLQQLEERGVDHDCPRCSQRKWNIELQGLSFTGEYDGWGVERPKMRLPVVLIVCENCGYLVMHAVRVLDLPSEIG